MGNDRKIHHRGSIDGPIKSVPLLAVTEANHGQGDDQHRTQHTLSSLLPSLLQPDAIGHPLLMMSPTLSALASTILRHRILRHRALLEQERIMMNGRHFGASFPPTGDESDSMNQRNESYSWQDEVGSVWATHQSETVPPERSSMSTQTPDGLDESTGRPLLRRSSTSPNTVHASSHHNDNGHATAATEQNWLSRPYTIDSVTSAGQQREMNWPEWQPLLSRDPLSVPTESARPTMTMAREDTDADSDDDTWMAEPVITDPDGAEGPAQRRPMASQGATQVPRNIFRDALMTSIHPSQLSTQELSEEIARIHGLIAASQSDSETCHVLQDRVRLLENIYTGRVTLQRLVRGAMNAGTSTQPSIFDQAPRLPDRSESERNPVRNLR